MPIIKIKRGPEANRLSITPVSGEMLYTTDTKKVYIGNGVTAGGIPINSASSEILSSIKTVDGTGSGLDSDTVDGIDSSQLVRSDQSGSLTGELTTENIILSYDDKTVNTDGVISTFVYDTSKDSDGGAWRYKTAHTSWHNETLNTATRGATKEFPAMVLITVEAAQLTIYDLTSDGTPMWMIFNRISWLSQNSIAFWAFITKAVMKDGQLLVSSSNNAPAYNFINDEIFAYRNGTYIYDIGIADRHIRSTNTFDALLNISDHTINDIDIMVTPNAKLDPVSGMPIPTLAFATNNGVSIIGSNRIGSNITGIFFVNNISNYISFDKDYKLWFGTRESQLDKFAYIVKYGDIPTQDLSNTLSNLYTTSLTYDNYPTKGLPILSISDNITDFDPNGGAAVNGDALTLISPHYQETHLNMVNHITNVFQSGWLPLNCKGAFLGNSKTADRHSPGSISLVETGSITEESVAVGSDLKSYTDFSGSDYLTQSYNSELDFGTGDFYIACWLKTNSANAEFILDRRDAGNAGARITMQTETNKLRVVAGISLTSATSVNTNDHVMIMFTKKDGVLSIYINGKLDAQDDTSAVNLTNNTAVLNIGTSYTKTSPVTGNISLLRIGSGAPTEEQIQYMYNTERPLFLANKKCTLSGNSSGVARKVSYDIDTDLLYVSGSNNLDTFSGLVNVSNEAINYTSLSSENGTLAKGI